MLGARLAGATPIWGLDLNDSAVLTARANHPMGSIDGHLILAQVINNLSTGNSHVTNPPRPPKGVKGSLLLQVLGKGKRLKDYPQDYAFSVIILFDFLPPL
jgi:hypothetical protein